MTTAALNTSQDAKGFGVIQAEWYLNQNLPVNADFANAEFNYQEFIVAYQELLRGRETLAHDTRRIGDNTNVLVMVTLSVLILIIQMVFNLVPFIPSQKKLKLVTELLI